MAEAPLENYKCEAIDSCFTECKTVKMSFEWTIKNFMELPQANGERLHSEVFPSSSDQLAYWKLAIYPRGENKFFENYVGLFLVLHSSQDADVRAKFTFESKDIHGKTIGSVMTSDVLTFGKASHWGYKTFLLREVLQKSLTESKSDALVIHCSVIIFLDICHRSLCETKNICLTQKEKFKVSFKWTIKNFVALPQVNGEVLESKVFPSANEQPAYWKLRVYPKGANEDDKGSVSFYLQLQLPERKVSTKVTVVAEDINGNTVVEPRSEFHSFDLVSKDFGYRDYVKRDTLIESLKRSENDTLVIHCSIVVFLDFSNTPKSDSGFSGNASHDTRLSAALQRLLLDESYSDFVINIDNRKFKVHKNILHVRSPIFASMLSSNFKEGNTSEVTLDDVDPDVFEKVLQFIYTDQLLMMPTDALDILPVADKYNIPSLIQKCADVLKCGICIETAVKTLILAEAHSMNELKKKAVRYICWNAEVISKTGDWSLLFASYPKLAAELFLASALAKKTV